MLIAALARIIELAKAAATQKFRTMMDILGSVG
jgi:hypothetical protein